MLCKYFTKSYQSKFKFSHIFAARKPCKHYVKLLYCTADFKGKKGTRLDFVKEKSLISLSLNGRGAQGVYTSGS